MVPPAASEFLMADKVEKVMHEYKAGTLHSGSPRGPVVKNRSQAIAIALSEARKAGQDAPAPTKPKTRLAQQ